MTTDDNTDDNTPDFERALRRRLDGFADQVPTSVRQLDDLVVEGDLSIDSGRRGGSTRRRIAGIGAAVIALGGGVALTTVVATGGDDRGANTPEQAVLEFLEAIEQRDVIGAIDVLDPAESAVMVDVVSDVAREAKRVGLLSERADLNDVSGTNLEVDELVLSSEAIGSGLSLVHLDAGRADIRFDFADLPIGASLEEAIARGDDAPTIEGTTIDLSQNNLSIATVERGGHWYVSIAFTVAELVRDAAGWPSPLDADVASEGFESPQEAATAFWTRLADFDLGGAIATTAPDEGDALARYSSLWVPDAEQALNGPNADGLRLGIDGLTFETTGDGDRRTAVPTAYRIVGTLPAFDTEGAPPFDETRPTLVFTTNGTGIYVIPAGDPIPESFDELEIMPDFDPATLSIDTWNSATLLPNGSLQTFWSEPGDLAAIDATRPFTLDFADGCATVSGITSDTGLGPSFGSGAIEALPNGDLRSCGPTDAVTSLGAVAFFFGAGSPPALPSIAVTEVDGRWYVSPIGSIGSMMLEVMAGMDDDGALAFTGPLGSYVYGATPGMLEQMLIGQNSGDIAEPCRNVVFFDGGGVVTGLLESPPIDAVRDCLNGGPFTRVGVGVAEPADIEVPTITTDLFTD